LAGDILVFFLKLKASRNLNHLIGIDSDSIFLDNFTKMFPVLGINRTTLERIPDYGTLNYLLKKINPEDLEKVQVRCVKRLIQKRVLEPHRLLDEHYQIAIDGTRIVTFKERHCAHCLRRKNSKNKDGYEYYHYVLTVCLVSKQGICIPIMTEFVENESPDVSKQDCEKKAFYRLAPKLKSYFPKTKLCLLLDAMFLGKPSFDLCNRYKWKFIISFKENLPSTLDEFYRQKQMYPDKTIHHPVDAKIKQDFFWSNELNHENLLLKAVECIETTAGNQSGYFCFLTNIPINLSNFKQITKGGRTRWKTENEGFNTLKNRGYQLQHLYGHNYTAMKNFCALLTLGFTISQFVTFAIGKTRVVKKFGSISNMFWRYYAILADRVLSNSLVETISAMRYQIRLDYG